MARLVLQLERRLVLLDSIDLYDLYSEFTVEHIFKMYSFSTIWVLARVYGCVVLVSQVFRDYPQAQGLSAHACCGGAERCGERVHYLPCPLPVAVFMNEKYFLYRLTARSCSAEFWLILTRFSSRLTVFLEIVLSSVLLSFTIGALVWNAVDLKWLLCVRSRSLLKAVRVIAFGNRIFVRSLALYSGVSTLAIFCESTRFLRAV